MVKAQVILDECRDEVIAVVVTRLHPQRQRLGCAAARGLEHVRMQLGSGQLARHVGLPWRSAAGSAANCADAQGAIENCMGLWGAMAANATLVVHSAGWLEGGLSFGYEKFITDLEAVQMVADLCRPTPSPAASATRPATGTASRRPAPMLRSCSG